MTSYLFLGLGHGVNDCVSGFVVGSLYFQSDNMLELGLYTLLYNLIAFGGQVPVAKLLEGRFSPKKIFFLCFVLLGLSLFMLNIYSLCAVLFAGIASAFYHVCGGMEAVREDNRAFGLGLFASPGVLGLVIGAYLAHIQFNFVWPGMILCLIGFIAVFFYQSPLKSTNADLVIEEAESHDLIMCLLVTVIACRSLVWDIVNLVQEKNFLSLFVIAIAAMCGKISGGFLSDRLGQRQYTLAALILSVPLLTVFKKNLAALATGVWLLQSTIPSTTVLLLKSMKRKPSFAIAFSFGLSIFVALLALYSPLRSYLKEDWLTFVFLLTPVLILVVMNWAERRKPGKINLLNR